MFIKWKRLVSIVILITMLLGNSPVTLLAEEINNVLDKEILTEDEEGELEGLETELEKTEPEEEKDVGEDEKVEKEIEIEEDLKDSEEDKSIKEKIDVNGCKKAFKLVGDREIELEEKLVDISEKFSILPLKTLEDNSEESYLDLIYKKLCPGDEFYYSIECELIGEEGLKLQDIYIKDTIKDELILLDVEIGNIKLSELRENPEVENIFNDNDEIVFENDLIEIGKLRFNFERNEEDEKVLYVKNIYELAVGDEFRVVIKVKLKDDYKEDSIGNIAKIYIDNEERAEFENKIAIGINNNLAINLMQGSGEVNNNPGIQDHLVDGSFEELAGRFIAFPGDYTWGYFNVFGREGGPDSNYFEHKTYPWYSIPEDSSKKGKTDTIGPVPVYGGWDNRFLGGRAYDGRLEVIELINKNDKDGVKDQPVPDGNVVAELNAEVPGMLFQLVRTKPGTVYRWQLYHKGRLQTDYMQVQIGPNPYETITDHKEVVLEEKSIEGVEEFNKNIRTKNTGQPYPHWDAIIQVPVYGDEIVKGAKRVAKINEGYRKGLLALPAAKHIVTDENDKAVLDENGKVKTDETLTTDKSKWKKYIGTYTVPAENINDNVTVFGFRALGDKGKLQSGNLLDHISFTESKMNIDKKVSKIISSEYKYNSEKDKYEEKEIELSSKQGASVGDTIIYEINLENITDLKTTASIIDFLPEGLEITELGDKGKKAELIVTSDTGIENEYVDIALGSYDESVNGSFEEGPVAEGRTRAIKIDVGEFYEDVVGKDTSKKIVRFAVKVTEDVETNEKSEIVNRAKIEYYDTDFRELDLEESSSTEENLTEYNKIYLWEASTEASTELKGKFDIEKLALKNGEEVTTAKVGDILTYKIEVTNPVKGTSIDNIVVTDKLPKGTKYIEESLKAEGSSGSGYIADTKEIKVQYPSLSDKDSYIIEFDVELLSDSLETVKNIVTSTGEKKDNLDLKIIDGYDEYSLNNPMGIEISKKAEIVKENLGRSNKALEVEIGDLVEYTIEIKNSGSAEKMSIKLEDILPEGIEIEEGSVTINNADIAYKTEVEGDQVKLIIENIRIESSQPLEIKYRVRIGEKALELGRLTNIAKIYDGDEELGEAQSVVDINKIKEYTVDYLIKDTKESLKPRKEVTGNIGEIVTEYAPSVLTDDEGNKYKLVGVKINDEALEPGNKVDLTINAKENKIVFEYEKIEQVEGQYIVRYVEVEKEDFVYDDIKRDLVEESILVGEVGSTVSFIDKDTKDKFNDYGYEFVRYMPSDNKIVIDGKIVKELIAAYKAKSNPTDPEEPGEEIYAKYSVEHKGTGEPDNDLRQLAGPDVYTGRIGTTITFNSKEFTNYILKSEETIPLTILSDEDSNKIVFNYLYQFDLGILNGNKKAFIKDSKGNWVKINGETSQERKIYPGDTIRYTIYAKNLGGKDSRIDNVLISDEFPTNENLELLVDLVKDSFTIESKFTKEDYNIENMKPVIEDNKFSLGLPSLTNSSGEDSEKGYVAISFELVVNDKAAGKTIKNIASITGVNPNNPEEKIEEKPSEEFEVTRPADVTIEKTNNKSKVNIGESFDYEILIKNNDTVDWKGNLEDVVPKELDILEILIDGELQGIEGIKDNKLIIKDFVVKAGQTRTLTIEVKVNNTALPGQKIYNLAVGNQTNENGDIIPGTDLEGKDEGVEIFEEGSAHFVTNKSAEYRKSETDKWEQVSLGETKLTEGDQVKYTITALVEGEEGAILEGVKISDKLPEGLTFKEALTKDAIYDEGTVSLEVGTLKVGESRTLEFIATVNGEVTGRIKNTGEVIGIDPNNPDEPDVEEEPGTEIDVPTKMKIAKVVSEKKVNIGDKVGYTINLENVDDKGIWKGNLKDTLDSRLKLVDGSIKLIKIVDGKEEVVDLVEKDIVKGQEILIKDLSLNPGDKYKLTFDVVVNGTAGDKIVNVGIAEEVVIDEEGNEEIIDEDRTDEEGIEQPEIEVVRIDGVLKLTKEAYDKDGILLKEKSNVDGGDVFTYRIKVLNEGEKDSSFNNIEISDSLLSDFEILETPKVRKLLKENLQVGETIKPEDVIEEKEVTFNGNNNISVEIDELKETEILILDIKVKVKGSALGELINEGLVTGLSPKTGEVYEASDKTILVRPSSPVDPGRPIIPKLPKEPVEPTTPELGLELNREDHFAYMQGYPDKEFKPKKNMTRAEVAAMFARLASGGFEVASGGRNIYTDVKDNFWYTDYITFLSDYGIIEGYEDCTFKPNAPITRAEFAAISTRFDNIVGTANGFKDVKDSHWAKDYIDKASSKGWILGYEDGTFRPENNITREEAVTLVNRVLERSADLEFIKNNIGKGIKTYADVESSRWSYGDIQEASNGHDYSKDDKEKETWIKLWK